MSLAPLMARAGRWRGTSALRDPESGIDERCPSEAVVTPAVGGRFVRLDYTWSYRGAPQEGMLLVGFDPATARCTVHWADSWHMRHEVMACQGSAGGALVSVRGSYAAPPGPDWGWRIELDPEAGDDGLRLTMYNVTPEGHEELAVDAVYARA